MPMVPRRLPMQKSAETTQLYHSCCGKKAGDCPGCPQASKLVKKAQLTVPTYSPNKVQSLRGVGGLGVGGSGYGDLGFGRATGLSDAEALRRARNSFWAKHIYRKPERPTRYEDIKRKPGRKKDLHLDVDMGSGGRLHVNLEEIARNLGIHPSEPGEGTVPLPDSMRDKLRGALKTYNKYRDAIYLGPYRK